MSKQLIVSRYWDWTLDWEDMASSPIWDPEIGFGGDGDPNSQIIISHGRCVTDGPFANLTPLFNRTEYSPHCLSRGFVGSQNPANASFGRGLKPEIIQDVLQQDTFEGFHASLEKGLHKELPEGVRGDFFGFSAPYGKHCLVFHGGGNATNILADPVFALHHSQLDRLWWLWQQKDMKRLTKYKGKRSGNGSRGQNLEASTSDVLAMHGLASKGHGDRGRCALLSVFWLKKFWRGFSMVHSETSGWLG